MEKIFYKAFFILMLLSDNTTFCFANEKHERQGHSNCKIEKNESTRGSPADTARYSVMVNGSTNTISINDQLMVSNSDSTNRKNKILVDGEGNTISIVQNEQQSKVSISQKGRNNSISIIQK